MFHASLETADGFARRGSCDLRHRRHQSWPARLVCPMLPPRSPLKECLQKLNEWAKLTRRYTELVYEQSFRKKPGEYGHSEAYFRSLCLVIVLQRHCGLRYNPAKIPKNVPLGTADTFPWGDCERGGNLCFDPRDTGGSRATVGVYPIKIAASKGIKWGHRFARWDDPNGERLNLEAAGKGLNTYL